MGAMASVYAGTEYFVPPWVPYVVQLPYGKVSEQAHSVPRGLAAMMRLA